ncbi:GldG family protein [bacterium]|nr:GldG family protein [bacterium]
MATRSFIFLILGVLLAVAGYVVKVAQAGVGLWYIVTWALAALALGFYVARNLSELGMLFTRRAARYGAVSVSMSLLFIGILVLAALFSEKHNHRWDLTKNKTHSLALQSRQVLEKLDRDTLDLNVYVFYRGEGDLRTKQPLLDLLETYSLQSKRFKFEKIDIDRNPLLAMQMGITSTSTVLIRYGEKTDKIFSEQEAKLTSSINSLIGGASPGARGAVYFTTGHGEPGTDQGDPYSVSRVRQSIEDQIGPVREAFLATGKGVPDSCDILIVDGPKKDFLPVELKDIDSFLARGGRALFLLEPFMPDTLLTEQLGRYGVKAGHDIVVDMLRGSPNSPFAFLVKDYPTHDITRFFDVGTVFDMVRSVAPDSVPPPGATVNRFLESSEKSWAESDLGTLQNNFDQVIQRASDQGHKVSLGVSVELEPSFFQHEDSTAADSTAKPRAARLVVIGDGDFISDTYIEQLGNRDLLLNCLRWLRGQNEDITIQPRETENTPLVLERSDMLTMAVVTLVALPLVIILTGVFIRLRRRAKR